MSWDKLCRTKADGGMGFKDLDLFTKAMLAKHVWRLLQRPHSLVAQTLKHKYFPRGDFMSTKLGSQPSFLWKSFLHGRDFPRKGLRLRIGYGSCVKAFRDPWLPIPTSFLPITSPCFLQDNLLVSELIQQRKWNEQLLHVIFNSRDRNFITQIPLNPTAGKDKQIWHFIPHGCFTVSSAYRVAMQEILSPKQPRLL